jgi:hypothetical protein
MSRRLSASSFLLLCASLGIFPACGGGGASSTAADAPTEQGVKKYPIVLERSYAPNVKYPVELTHSTTERAVMSAGGAVVGDQTKTKLMSFVGTRTSLAEGKHAPGEFEVTEISIIENGEARLNLPKGTKISRSVEDDSWQYSVDGEPVPEEVAKAFSSLFGGKVNGPGDDDVFGSSVPRAIGERWDIDPTKLPSDEDATLDPEGATGFTKLVGVRDVDGVECLEVEAEVSVPHVTLNNLPPGSKLHGASFTGSFTGLFPTDDSLPSLAQTMAFDMKMQMEVESPKGPVQLDMHMQAEEAMKRK